MTGFPLKIVTPDGLAFDGQAEELVVRTTTGDLGILAGHVSCVAPLGMGRATIVTDGKRRYAACIGGMVSVVGGNVTLVPTTFEWAENIDVARAGGKVAGDARKAIETQTGVPVITSKNAAQLSEVVTNLLEDAGNKEK